MYHRALASSKAGTGPRCAVSCVRVWNRGNRIRFVSSCAAAVHRQTVVYSINYKLPDRNKCDLTIRLNYTHIATAAVATTTITTTTAAIATDITNYLLLLQIYYNYCDHYRCRYITITTIINTTAHITLYQ